MHSKDGFTRTNEQYTPKPIRREEEWERQGDEHAVGVGASCWTPRGGPVRAETPIRQHAPIAPPRIPPQEF
eukprot:138388-Pyramimonas_sp.AAC.1